MSVRDGLIAGLLGNVVSALVGFAVIPVYLRLLGPEGYGLVGFFVTLQGWALLADLGLSTAMNRELARFSAGVLSPVRVRELLSSVERAYAVLAVALGLLVIALAHPLAAHWLQAGSYPQEALARSIALMGLALASQWMTALYRACLLGLQRQALVGLATGASGLVRGIATVAVLAFASPSIDAFLWTQVALGAIESLALWRFVAARLPAVSDPVRASWQALSAVRPFALGVAATMILASVLTQLDKLLVARWVTLEQFGYFMLAVMISSGLSVLMVPMNNVVFPRFSEHVAAADGDGLAREYHRFSQLLSVGLLPPALLLALFAEPVLRVWTGDATAARAAAPIMSVWVLGTALNGIMLVPYAAQLAHGWTRLGATLNVVAAVCMVPALAYLVPRFGPVAAAWVWVAINVSYIGIGVPLMHRRILRGEKASWYVRDLLAPFAGCAVASLVMFTIASHSPANSRLGEAAFLGVALLALAAGAALGSAFVRSQLLQSLRRPASLR
jgi:O-antigen/teichoic acid export membrane protein